MFSYTKAGNYVASLVIAGITRGCWHRSWLLSSLMVAAVARRHCRRPSSLLSHDVAVNAHGCWHRVLLPPSRVIAAIAHNRWHY